MKKRIFISIFVVVGLLMAFLLSSSTEIITGEPEFRVKRFPDWMRSLPEETRMQVKSVFKKNLDCLIKGDKESVPDEKQWFENFYREIMEVLTPEELMEFDKIFHVNKQGDHIFYRSTTCGDCMSFMIVLPLAYAEDELDDAIDDYNSSYCDFGFGPDSVYIYIGMARNYTVLAEQERYDAYQTCDCDSAEDAYDYAVLAATRCNTALANTIEDCSSSAPWKEHLEQAKVYLDYLSHSVNSPIKTLCIAQACD